ncbi:hypothetical protein [Deinococcus aquiradiocola]|nr:hypothetical protein [Deinococcus aquiradiocola]
MNVALPASPLSALPVLARLYGCREEDLAGTAAQLTAALTVRDAAGLEVGALGLRPSPAHGSEVLGGALPGDGQRDAALALLRAALTVQPQLYAYAEPHLLPVTALEAAGLRSVGAYTRMTGLLPTVPPVVPAGFRAVPLQQVASLHDRMAAQRSYADRIGHTLVPPEFVQPGAGGCDETLSRLAYDEAGIAVGICRVWRDGGEVSCTTPGIHPAARGSGLRQALLLSVCQAALAAGAVTLRLDAWGDTPQERAADEALGLTTEECTPIYAATGK